jgi:hypothetical protein
LTVPEEVVAGVMGLAGMLVAGVVRRLLASAEVDRSRVVPVDVEVVFDVPL